MHTWSLNLTECVIPVHELLKQLITSINTVTASFKSINPVRRPALLLLGPSTVNFSDCICWRRLFLLTPLLAADACCACVQQEQRRCAQPYLLPFPAPIPVSLYSHYSKTKRHHTTIYIPLGQEKRWNSRFATAIYTGKRNNARDDREKCFNSSRMTLRHTQQYQHSANEKV